MSDRLARKAGLMRDQQVYRRTKRHRDRWHFALIILLMIAIVIVALSLHLL